MLGDAKEMLSGSLLYGYALHMGERPLKECRIPISLLAASFEHCYKTFTVRLGYLTKTLHFAHIVPATFGRVTSSDQIPALSQPHPPKDTYTYCQI
jgi:hypothetical protein